MSERPILFSGAMVRALLAGQKTQTRRIANVPYWPRAARSSTLGPGPQFYPIAADGFRIGHVGVPARQCRYGVPGDRLWVRERVDRLREGLEVATAFGDRAVYAADGALTKLDTWPWKRHTLPGIHCPRGLSRITLEVVEVRLQWLQDISEEDAKAEGIGVSQRATAPGDEGRSCVNCGQHRDQHVGAVRVCPQSHGQTYSTWTYRGGYAILWDQINGKKAPWASNPLVWAVTFPEVRR